MAALAAEGEVDVGGGGREFRKLKKQWGILSNRLWALLVSEGIGDCREREPLGGGEEWSVG